MGWKKDNHLKDLNTLINILICLLNKGDSFSLVCLGKFQNIRLELKNGAIIITGTLLRNIFCPHI